MSFFFGGGGGKQKPQYTGLQIQTSSNSMPVALVWGQTRISPNLIWHGDFKTHKKKQKAGKGGPKITTYTYSSSIMMALCEGQIVGIGRVFKDKEQTSFSALGFSLFVGSDPQAAWGYLTSAHPDEAFSYPGTAYLAAANYDLGQSANLPNHTFEVQALRYDTFPSAGGDALPSYIVEDFLIHPRYGCGLPDTVVDTDTLYSTPAGTTTGDSTYETYCRVMGFGLSPALTDQEEAGSILARWMKLTNSEVVWNGYQLKFVPYGTEEITANGYHYVPQTIKTPVYTLGDDDYIASRDRDPLVITRVDLADAHNAVKLEFKNRDNQYNLLPVEWKDQGLIDQFGPRWGSMIKAHEITREDMAVTVATLISVRNAYQKNKYEFTLPPGFCLLEPTDVLVVYDPKLGFTEVIIEEIEEDEDNNLSITAREHPAGVNNYNPAQAESQPVVSNPTNSGVSPGSVNPPVFVEPTPALLDGDSPEVWIAVSGGDGTDDNVNWGGCIVYVSTDNVTYQAIGEIDTPARMGKLSAALASTVTPNPTGQTLQVDLSMSDGQLLAASAADAARGVTLCYVDGEFVSYETPTLTAINKYDITGLYRGLYGTGKDTHALGTAFARLDESIFKYDLPSDFVGQTLYFKFQSYNIFGLAHQDLSSCVAYSYVPDGAGFPEGVTPPGAPEAPVGTSGILSNKLQWSEPTSGGAPNKYVIYGAPGTGVAFSGTSPLGSTDVDIKTFTHAGLGVSQAWTYYIVASNINGEGVPSAAINLTTSSSGGGGGGGGGGWTPTIPVSADFPIVKTGTGMVAPVIADIPAALGSGVRMEFWRNNTASNWRQAYFLKTVSAVPFRAEALIVNTQQSLDNWFMFGMAMGCSGDINKHIRVGDLMDANFRFPYTTKNTGLNTSEANLTTILQPNNTINYGQNQKWVALEYDGTNINAYVSIDGYAWWKAASEPASFFTAAPDQIGFGWEAVASDGGTQHVTCRHYRVTTNLTDAFGLNRV